MIFNNLIHLEEQFAHDGGEGDFGWFAGCPQAQVKLSQVSIRFAGQGYCRHVEAPPESRAAAADVSLSLPRPALPGPGRQPGQRGGLPPVKPPQFGHLAEHADGGEGSDPVELGKFPDLGLDLGGAFEGGRQFGFRRFNLLGYVLDQNGLLADDERGCSMFTLVADRAELHFEGGAPLDERAQFGQDDIGCRRRCGLQSLAVGSEHGGINRVALGAAALRQCEVTDLGWIDDGYGQVPGMQPGDHGLFVATGGFTNNMHCGNRAQERQEAAMTRWGVGQHALSALEVELQGGFGNIHSGVDGGRNLRQCFHVVRDSFLQYELALVGRSINGSSNGHRARAALAPPRTRKKRFKRATSSPAPPSPGLQAGRRHHLPSPIRIKQGR